MRSHIAQFFEVKFRYEKTQEDGLVKMVTEAYAIDAMTWSEVEKRIVEEMAAYAQGEAEIRDIRKAQYKEVLFSDKEADDNRASREIYSRCHVADYVQLRGGES